MGVGDQRDESLEQPLLRRLRAHPLLRVLDNCEHVLPAVSALAESVLRSCPPVVVLATSRQHLDVEGERVFAVAPLDLSPAEGTEDLSEAGLLFVDRSGPPATDSELVLVAEICRRLEEIPLAIELAAAR